MAYTDIRMTAAEKTRMATLVARACKRGVAGQGVTITDLTGRMDRIQEQAAQRTERENDAMARELDTARHAVAKAKTAYRVADREGKPAAKDQLKRAEDALRRTERAARKLGL